MSPRRWRRRAAALATTLCAAGAACPPSAAAQGPGSAGAQLLTLTAGTRAAAFAGAYTAVIGDPEGVFYNPAAAAWVGLGVGLGYQEYVEGVVLGSLAGNVGVGPLGVGAGVVYLDAGEIEEVVPDAEHAGQRGRSTGQVVDAVETAARLALALPLLHDRLSAGLGLGVFTSDLAGAQRQGLFLDLGTQVRLGDLTLGAALRHLGDGLSGEHAAETPLPLEARLGGAYRRPLAGRYGVHLATDVVVGIEEETVAFALGGEAGLLPGDRGVSAVVRGGATLGGGAHIGRVRVGAGIGVGGLFFDYAIQSFEYFGAIHRLGVRWVRGG